VAIIIDCPYPGFVEAAKQCGEEWHFPEAEKTMERAGVDVQVIGAFVVALAFKDKGPAKEVDLARLGFVDKATKWIWGVIEHAPRIGGDLGAIAIYDAVKACYGLVGIELVECLECGRKQRAHLNMRCLYVGHS
jgi:hypothetical protein